ncbi:hypothetical protein ACT691_11100 [Vibrio metschnikovii]
MIAIDVLYEANKYGQKNGHGFYRYSIDKKGKPKKNFSDEILPLLADVCANPQPFEAQTIIERMMIPMINEVVLCLEEGIIASPQEADMASGLRFRIPSIPWWGFPLPRYHRFRAIHCDGQTASAFRRDVSPTR